MPTGRLWTWGFNPRNITAIISAHRGVCSQRYNLWEQTPLCIHPLWIYILTLYFSATFKGGYFYMGFIFFTWAVCWLHETTMEDCFVDFERLILTTRHINVLRTFEQFVLISHRYSLIETCGIVHVGDTCSTIQGKLSNSYFKMSGTFPGKPFIWRLWWICCLSFFVLPFSDNRNRALRKSGCIECLLFLYLSFKPVNDS